MTLHFQMSIVVLTRCLWFCPITGGDGAIFPSGSSVGGVTPWHLLTIGISTVVFL